MHCTFTESVKKPAHIPHYEAVRISGISIDGPQIDEDCDCLRELLIQKAPLEFENEKADRAIHAVAQYIENRLTYDGNQDSVLLIGEGAASAILGNLEDLATLLVLIDSNDLIEKEQYALNILHRKLMEGIACARRRLLAE